MRPPTPLAVAVAAPLATTKPSAPRARALRPIDGGLFLLSAPNGEAAGATPGRPRRRDRTRGPRRPAGPGGYAPPTGGGEKHPGYPPIAGWAAVGWWSTLWVSVQLGGGTERLGKVGAAGGVGRCTGRF